ncbi:5'-nucleotidase C-terminal domain-containing protein [Limimaricola cinnabarinus]|uniref:5'-nucleotidase C-terminal domain-containing protein n=1 Tax=Limimaricola cinnabarinus TaxID=1125964 RepID=UPI0003FBC9D0|nr:5'-nucleotidase C-terminal domain-containing protein [Limimaricola cinnabarinus]
MIDLDLWRAAPGALWYSRGAGRIETPTARGCDAATALPVRRAHRAALAALSRPVGHSTLPIDSHFALVAPDRSLQLAADALRAAAQRMLKGRAEAALPLLVAVRPFCTGGHGGAGHYLSLPAGMLTERHLQALHPHPDRLCLTVVDRAALLDWLERGAALFCRVLPGRRDQPLIDPSRPPYGFEVIDGLGWRIDPSRPAGQGRVGDLRHEGRPVGPADRFVIAMTSHHLGGDGPLPRRLRAGQLPIEGPLLREALRAHLVTGPVTPRPRPSWRFAALPGTAAWFDAPPEARKAAAGVASRQITPVGPADDGYHRYQLRFGPEAWPIPSTRGRGLAMAVPPEQGRPDAPPL